MLYEQVKFWTTFLSVALFIWRASAWVTRKHDGIETFFSDVRRFMDSTDTKMTRIETNHMAHQEKYLKEIAKAVGAKHEEDSDAIHL